MAKMIKCPTCATQIEVPPQASGQIVKCPGCGKGLKLVAKKPPGAGGAGQMTASGSPISKESSVAGGSISAMTFHDEPPLQNDPPSLDTCAVCGRPTDFADLVEDNGKLVCADCIKGARSSIARPKGGADLIGFKAPEYRPTKRGKLVNVTPAFLAAAAFGLIWVGCQLYLSMTPKPEGKGVAIARPTKPGPTVPEVLKPTPEVSPAPVPATQPEVVTVPEPAPAPPVAPEPASQPAVALGPTPPAPKPGSELFPPDPNEAKPAPVPVPPANADPLERGMAALQAGDYKAAKLAFDEARKTYILVAGGLRPGPLTPQQAQALNGLAAANIGLGKPEDAKPQLDLLAQHQEQSRGSAVNRALAYLGSPNSKPAELRVAIPALKQYLDAAPADDETAVDAFGSMLAKLSAIPTVNRNEMEALWKAWDVYVDRLGTKNEGKLKWGIEWLPADEVKALRQSRSIVTGISPDKAGKNLALAQAKAKAAQTALDKAEAAAARGNPAGVPKAQADLEAANKALEDAKRDYAGVTQKAAQWLSKFEPVVP